MRPRVGETWLADLRGKVDWCDTSMAAPGPVRLEWVADDSTVVVGIATRPRCQGKRVTLARCLLVERVSA